MNRLPRDKQIQVINALVEGCSIRSVERLYDVHRDTITRLMVRTGQHCMTILEDRIKGIPAGVYQCDEIWCYVGKKDQALTPEDGADPRIGSQFIFVAMDAKTKLVISHRVGKRLPVIAHGLMVDIRDKTIGIPTIVTDGFAGYRLAVDSVFDERVNFAQLVKTVTERHRPIREGYTPAKVVRCDKHPICGRVKPEQISTSLIERQNLTMRMSMRRLTRLTNGFSKKLDNLKAATALHFAHYNLCRVHRSLRVTPAMAAGVVGSVWDVADLVPV